MNQKENYKRIYSRKLDYKGATILFDKIVRSKSGDMLIVIKNKDAVAMIPKGKIRVAYVVGENEYRNVHFQIVHENNSLIEFEKEAVMKKKSNTRESQRKLNYKNSKKKITKLLNINFNNDDLMVTLTHSNEYFSEREIRKNIQNYIRRLRRYRNRVGLDELKYLYTIGFMEMGSSNIRVHYNIIINNMDMEIVKKLWNKDFAAVTKIKKDDFGFHEIARYLYNGSNSSIRWSYGNLKQINKVQG